VLTLSPQRSLLIDDRHAGLPGLAHGGYVSGLVAGAVAGDAAEVRLRRPVEVGRDVSIVPAADGSAELRDGDTVLAEGRPTALDLELPPLPSAAEAQAATRRFPGHHHHRFPYCLVCGPLRAAGDGLRIFPGPVPGRQLVAATWVPDAGLADADGRIPDELVWAALDCPQLWSLMTDVPASIPDLVVTAALAGRLEAPVLAGEPHTVIGWPIGREGRTWLAGAAVIGPAGELFAIGRQVAAVTSWGIPLGRDHWQEAQDQHTTDRRTK
jgi:hypothetical protein